MAYRVLFLLAFIFVSCQEKPLSVGDQTIDIYKDTNVYFNMELVSEPSPHNDSILRLSAGRVLLKKVKLPEYQLQTEVVLNVTLTSNGDPWDKSGSLFVIPKDTDLTLIDFEDKTFDLTKLDEVYPAVAKTTYNSLNYSPNVELLRFMTPFGVGHFTNSERTKARKPIYIPHWEKEVNWTRDITHLLPLLENEAYIGIFIDTWSGEGYNISVSLDFRESEAVGHQKKKQEVLSLVNTNKYGSAQPTYDHFSKEDLEVNFDIDRPIKNVQLHYTTTGHGGHGSGDEFVKKENIISLDGNIIKQFIPWRDDCASFRRFNPTSGTWKAKDIMPDETSEERIASSDFSRSNWCPGSDVTPEVIDIEALGIGKHSLKISIPEAQSADATKEHFNYWMVSAYLTYEYAD